MFAINAALTHYKVTIEAIHKTTGEKHRLTFVSFAPSKAQAIHNVRIYYDMSGMDILTEVADSCSPDAYFISSKKIN